MEGKKLIELNRAIAEAVPSIRRLAEMNPMFPVRMGVIKFSEDAHWQVEPIDIDEFQWVSIKQSATLTNYAQAVRLANTKIQSELGELAIPPVMVLVSDGEPSDKREYAAALKELTDSPWGGQSRRRAIAIGANTDIQPLVDFVAPFQNGVIRATDSSQLADVIRETCISVLLDAFTPIP